MKPIQLIRGSLCALASPAAPAASPERRRGAAPSYCALRASWQRCARTGRLEMRWQLVPAADTEEHRPRAAA